MKLLIILGVILVMFVSLIVLDFIWLGLVIKKFIINQFGSLIKVENGSIQIKLLIGLLTWFIIAIGCFIFAVYPSATIHKALLLGAVLGFVMYAVYDLTNLTFITNYPVTFVFVDIAWGTFLCAVISGIGFFVKNLF